MERRSTARTRQKGNQNVRLVHVCGGDGPRLVPFVHKSHHFIITAHNELRKIFDVGSKDGVLANPEVPRVLGIQQVPDLLVVDLKRCE